MSSYMAERQHKQRQAAQGLRIEAEKLKEENEKLKAALENRDEQIIAALTALKELGHYKIDFGFGEYDCNVAKVAQDAVAKIEGLKTQGEIDEN